MKIVIDETYSNMLLVGKYYSKPVLVENAGISTPFEDRYKWANKDEKLAAHKGNVESVSIYFDEDNGTTQHLALNIGQIKSIVNFYNNTHNEYLEPDYVSEDQD